MNDRLRVWIKRRGRAVVKGNPVHGSADRIGGLRDQPEQGRQGGRQLSNRKPLRLIDGASGVGSGSEANLAQWQGLAPVHREFHQQRMSCLRSLVNE